MRRLLPSAKARAQLALSQKVGWQVPTGGFAPSHRRVRLEDNLVEGMTPDQLVAARAEFESGDGGELRKRPDGLPPNLHATYSSAALALNAFGRWRDEEASLSVGGHRGFESLTFERKCPAGTTGRQPNLDLVLSGEHVTVAVESKCTEYFDRHNAEFRDVYDEAVHRLADASWRQRYEALKREPNLFSYLDAAQLVKHYLGLRHTFPNRRCVLLYLYWEPTNGASIKQVVDHDEEVQRFTSGLADPGVAFQTQTYEALWSEWEGLVDPPPWVADHVAHLRGRYDVDVS